MPDREWLECQINARASPDGADPAIAADEYARIGTTEGECGPDRHH